MVLEPHNFDLTLLPEELLIEVLLKVDLRDLEAFSQTARRWLNFVARFQEVLYRRVYIIHYQGRALEVALNTNHTLKDLQEKLLAQSGLDIPRQHLSFSGLEVKDVVRKRGIVNPCKKHQMIQTHLRQSLQSGKILRGEYPSPEEVARLARYHRFLPSGTQLLLSDRGDLIKLHELFGSGTASVFLREEDSLESFKERVAHNFGESHIELVVSGGKVRSLDLVRFRVTKKIFAFRSVSGSPARLGSLIPLPNTRGVPLTTQVRFEFLLDPEMNSGGFFVTQLLNSLMNLNVTVSLTRSGLPIEGTIKRERVKDVITITFQPSSFQESTEYTVVATADDVQDFGLHFFQTPLPDPVHQICSAQWRHQDTMIYHFRT